MEALEQSVSAAKGRRGARRKAAGQAHDQGQRRRRAKKATAKAKKTA